jgi:hypothetical protein
MNSSSDIHYDSLPLNITYDQLISLSQFDEYIYKIKKQITVSELGLTFDYYTKIPREQVHASFVEPFIQKSEQKYIINDFIIDFKEGDVVTLNYINENGNKYYIHGIITNIDISNSEIEIKNNNPLFIPRTHRFDYYTMYFINYGKFHINQINKSLIKKD